MRPLDGVRKYQLIIAILFLVACIGYLIAVHALGIETEVMRDRFWKNADTRSCTGMRSAGTRRSGTPLRRRW